MLTVGSTPAACENIPRRVNRAAAIRGPEPFPMNLTPHLSTVQLPCADTSRCVLASSRAPLTL